MNGKSTSGTHPGAQGERPRIVVADGYTLNPGDLDWNPLQALGELTVYDRSGAALEANCKSAEIVLTNKEIIDAELLSRLPRLQFISLLATGTNVVDLNAATERGIIVSNVPAYSTESVAEHTFALLFALNNRVAQHADTARDGTWSSSGHFSYRLGPIAELAGSTLGIVGLGTIGRRVAAIARAFGMRPIAAQSLRGATNDAVDVPRVPLDQLFAEADVVSLHCPLTEHTRGLVNRERLRTMKPSSMLLNTGRGPLVDELALAEALAHGTLRGAGLDVLSTEPPPADHPLLRAPNCIVTPHLAWATVQARQRLLATTVANVRAFLSGAPQNVVSRA